MLSIRRSRIFRSERLARLLGEDDYIH